MRITNKIMQRNNLSNINTNKILEDKLSNQLSTEKKVTRPSDDPVIAIRALRLRTNVTEVTQYYDRNVSDANSWLTITEDALKSLSDVITGMIGQCTSGSKGDLTAKDRQIILEQLRAYSDEVYKTGDADYAGRYVFTGYRTDTPLSFQKAAVREYTLTEQIDKDVIDTITTVNSGASKKWTAANFDTDADVTALDEQDISRKTNYRIRLAYDNLDQVDASKIGISYWTGPDGSKTRQTLGVTSVVSKNTDPYSNVGDDDVIMVYETGELLLGKNAYDKLMGVTDDPTTAGDESEIRITYQKSEWTATDLRPEHYFYCKAKDAVKDPSTGVITVDDASEIEYNKDYLDTTLERQPIEYDVGFNTTIRINSTADECFKLGIRREVDDILEGLSNLDELEKVKEDIEAKIAATNNQTDLDKLNTQLDAVNKSLTYARDICQKRFEKGITTFQKYLSETSHAITANGTRSAKLDMIKSRLQTQKTTFETLQSENEDIDVTEVAIHLSSAETTYQAALMATGKIMQNTLLNYL